MKQYYFVGIILPELSFDSPPDISFSQLRTLLHDNLSPSDLQKTLAIRHFYDLLNIRALLLEEELDTRGEMSPLELGEALIGRVGLPDYVYAFMDTYESTEERLRHFPLLLARFFQNAEFLKDKFLRRYMQFERALRLVMTAFRAKKLGRDLAAELQYENPDEELIAQLLAKQNAEVYDPPEPFEKLKPIFEEFGNHPIELQKKLDEFRFETIESYIDMADGFSIERILAYFCQFLIVDQWRKLNKNEGLAILDTLFKNNR